MSTFNRILVTITVLLSAVLGTASAVCAAQNADTPTDASFLSTRIDSPPAPTSPWARQEITISSLKPNEITPKIDGALDDNCWRHATRASGFFRNQGSLPVAEQTEAWLLCDRKNIYVAFHCIDAHPELIRASETQRDGNIDGDDHVGIDIDSQGRHTGLSSFRVTARGTQSESIEGGTADNITWVGDWRAATRRTKDGWTCEIAIPFQLLRYPKGATSFGLALYRRLARETSREVWPYLPPEGDNNEAQYLHRFTGLNPPVFAARPVFLPYLLTTAGAEGNRTRAGMDIKYPLTTTLTGVATINPDFQTVEQQVADISFSYTEKYLPDHRPFFAEGGDFLPFRDQLYSLRIGQIDGGLKVVGREKDLSIGVLGTTYGGSRSDQADNPRQQVLAAQVNQNLGPNAHILGNIVQNSQNGSYETNRTAKIEGGWSTLAPNRYRPNIQVDYIPSWQGGSERGAKEFFHIGTGAPNGRPNTGMNFSVTPDDFISDLGYNPDRNQRGYSAWVEQYNNFDQGVISSYWTGFNFGSAREVHPDTFFSRYTNPEVYLEMRAGYAVDVSYNQSQRETYRDHTADYDFQWGRRTLFQRGGGHLTLGQVADQPYRYVSFNQSILLAKPLTLRLDQSWYSQGPARQAQTILTGSYRLTETRVLATRLVQQSGRADPASDDDVPVGTNIYFSFAQHVRAGYDLFVLIGDPNAVGTRGTLTVKVVQPF